MRKCILALVALLSQAIAGQTAYWQGQTYSAALPRGEVICDLTTGVATGVGAGTCVAHPATCDGVANDAQAFADFLTWANLTWQASYSGLVELYIPPGKSCSLQTTINLTATNFEPGCASGTYPFPCQWSSGNWSKGIKKFLMNFTGSSVTASGSAIITLAAGDGVCHNGVNTTKGCSARTATASIAATSITLLDTSQCSRFAAGDWVVMTGFAVQALYSAASSFGYPPNFAFYDYAKVVSTASCAGSGVITLDRSLTNDYKSTWPANAPGSVGEADQGGPATLYALPFWWDTEVEYRGGTFNNGSQQTNDAGRSVTYRDITWAGGIACTYPTQGMDWSVIGGDWSICKIEMDKIVVNASFSGAIVNEVRHQSMSPRYVTISGGSNITALVGTPRNITIGNSTISQTDDNVIGTTSFGRSDSFTITNSVVNGGIAPQGANENGSISAGVWSISGQSGGPYSATMTNGVITVPNTHGAVSWGVPGANLVFEFQGEQSTSIYQVLDITQDATNQYVTTTCVGANTVCGVGGGFPVASGSFKIGTHPAPKFNCSGVTGNVFWTSVCNGPVDAPLFSHQHYTADVSFPISSTNYVIAWGYATSLVFTVNSPYAGVGALNFRPTYQFGYPVYDPAGAETNYAPSIDLKTGGTRTITGSGCTGCGGADSGATLPYGATSWFTGKTVPNISAHPAWVGTIDVTMTFDQGVVNP